MSFLLEKEIVIYRETVEEENNRREIFKENKSALIVVKDSWRKKRYKINKEERFE